MECIVALATANIVSALHLIRVSGSDAFSIVQKIFNKTLDRNNKRHIYYGNIIFDNEIIDEVILLQYVAPNSYTGEDSFEIISHGSPLISNQIITALLSSGARMATNGEFTSRAFLNGKMDLVQCESVNDVINATTNEAKKIAQSSLVGDTSSTLYPIKKQIADLLSNIDVNIDYPEYEDIEVVTKQQIIDVCNNVSNSLKELIKDAKQAIVIKEGVKVALVGEPNVGKSSILNALLKEEKAIVTPIPGTTRDVVEGEIVYKGIKIKILDTAGIRETDDVVEGLGVEKSIKTIEKADIVINVTDGVTLTNNIDINTKAPIINVINKADLISSKEDGVLYISAKNGEVEPLLDEIIKILGVDVNAYQKPSFANARQLALLISTLNNLEQAKNEIEADVTIDLVSSYILAAFQNIKEIFGEEASFDMTEEIFSRFCVGK